ncbi:MAG TPA: cupredoxin family copper-binding protein [Acidimicrobiales bacterium]|jgi:plastocyanin|nr:cupredoxin family copper-binding protein [Acidimicrobiales bacterium]
MAAALVLAACGGDDGDTESGAGEGAGDQAASGGDEVVIERFMFMPEDIEVSAGTTVTWTNRDSAAHTVQDSGDLFPESEDIDQGGEFSFTYDQPGEYPYICGIHTYMTGTVTVS